MAKSKKRHTHAHHHPLRKHSVKKHSHAVHHTSDGFRERVRFTVKDFFFFAVLFVISLLLYKFVPIESYTVLFGLLAIVFGFIALAFLLVLLVLFFMRFLKK